MGGVFQSPCRVRWAAPSRGVLRAVVLQCQAATWAPGCRPRSLLRLIVGLLLVVKHGIRNQRAMD